MNVSLSARNIVKRYGGVVALSDGNLDLQSGETLALIGANGSGKSTLSKIINGVVVLDGGQLLLDGKATNFSSPHAARKEGIATVFQELSLIPQMTVAENIWLAREPLRAGGLVDAKVIHRRTQELLGLFEGTYKSALHPDADVASLPPDEKQIIEILKAISADPRLLILDEATASLDSRQVERLFELVNKWKQSGKAVIFVSHRMEEIFRIADNYSVLRNGVTVGAGAIKDVNERILVELMVEKAVASNVVKRSRQAGPAIQESSDHKLRLEVKDLQTDVLKKVSLQLHDGELLGIGGLKGQGQRDLLLALFGWMISSRMVRGLTMSLRDREFIQAARYMGVPNRQIIVPSGRTENGSDSKGLIPGAAPKKSPTGASTGRARYRSGATSPRSSFSTIDPRDTSARCVPRRADTNSIR